MLCVTKAANPPRTTSPRPPQGAAGRKAEPGLGPEGPRGPQGVVRGKAAELGRPCRGSAPGGCSGDPLGSGVQRTDRAIHLLHRAGLRARPPSADPRRPRALREAVPGRTRRGGSAERATQVICGAHALTYPAGGRPQSRRGYRKQAICVIFGINKANSSQTTSPQVPIDAVEGRRHRRHDRLREPS